MRRPVSVNNPMFIIHIDTWNWPDPQKIINLVPEDLKPWCVFNISLSVSHNETTGEFNIVPDGLETARSWVRTCAENRVWCMVQPASGAFSHLPDNEMEVYEEFYREYPNFIGFNYCEQFWGFRSIFSTDPLKYGVDVPVRLALLCQVDGSQCQVWRLSHDKLVRRYMALGQRSPRHDETRQEFS